MPISDHATTSDTATTNTAMATAPCVLPRDTGGSGGIGGSGGSGGPTVRPPSRVT